MLEYLMLQQQELKIKNSMKVSEITTEVLIEYGNYYEEDKKLLEQLLRAAISFVKNYTGLDDETMEDIEDLSIAVISLVNDMYENRGYTTNTTRVNPVVRAILGMYSRNLL